MKRRSTRQGVWACGLLALLSFGCGREEAIGDATTSLPALEPLHAVRGAAAGVYDRRGRQVLLRGVNLNALGDYYQANPTADPVIPLREDDFPAMARVGFNVVRLLVSWSSLEPQPGMISEPYIERIGAAVATAKANGIYVVLDMHQDAWGKFIASPPDVQCPAGREPAIGWDGAPEWATLTDGASTCRTPGVRETAPAVSQAFSSFYNDRDGIQTHLVNAWAALAQAFAAEPAVAGYDLLNEPHYVGGAAKLAGYYTRAIAAIRTAEHAAGGFAHIVFFEPLILWPVAPGQAPADFTDDDNLVFAPHNYAESITGLNNLTIEENFQRAVTDAAKYGTTFWTGEYGWFGDPPHNKARVVRYAHEEDRWLVGSTWWQWRQACGDPHTIGHPGGAVPTEPLIHFNRTGCPGDVDLGPVPEWQIVLSRPYPRAAPGQLESLVSDGDAGTLSLSGTTATPGELDLWIPAREAGPPRLAGTGSDAAQLVAVAGGYRALVPVAGQYTLAVMR